MSDTVEQLQNIISIMAKLRDPDTGCPWDVKQDFASIAPYTIEEAYEVADAIESGDREPLYVMNLAICCCKLYFMPELQKKKAVLHLPMLPDQFLIK